MGKIVSRNVISQSKEELIETDPNKVLTTYFCLCGEFILVLPGSLESLAIRPIDNSYVLKNKSTSTSNSTESTTTATDNIKVYKLNAVSEGLGVLLKRGIKSFEYQRRLLCPRCKLAVGYETVPGEGRKGNATFLLQG